MVLNFSRRGLLALSVMAVMSACASLPTSPPEEQVGQRAQQRLDALIAKDYKGVYEFFAPSYREKFPFEDWVRSRAPRATFVSAGVSKVECPTEDACEVQIESAYRAPRGVRAAPKGEIERVTVERWVRVDGRWWLYQDR
jgi:hypothetical protein